MSLFQAERQFLREHLPERIVHYLIFLPVMLTAFIPFIYRIHRGDKVILAVMSVLIIGAFWLVQLQSTYAAALTWQEDNHPESSQFQRVIAKFLAVIAHRWQWHLLITIALGGLALATAGYLSRIPMIEEVITYPDGTSTIGWFPMDSLNIDKGILRDYATFTIHQPLRYISHMPNPKAIAFAGIFLLIANIAAMVLSIAIGLGTGRSGAMRPMAIRVFIGIAGLLLFGTMFTVRGTVMKNIFRVPLLEPCSQLVNQTGWDCPRIERETFALRAVESTEQLGMALIDGGIHSTAVLLFTDFEPSGYLANSWVIETHFRQNNPPTVKFMFRHVLIILTASAIEIVLTAVFLTLAVRAAGNKKKKWR